MGKSKEVKITVRILYLFFIFLQKPIIFINFATECHLSGFTGSYMYVLYKLLLHHIFLRVWFFKDCRINRRQIQIFLHTWNAVEIWNRN